MPLFARSIFLGFWLFFPVVIGSVYLVGVRGAVPQTVLGIAGVAIAVEGTLLFSNRRGSTDAIVESLRASPHPSVLSNFPAFAWRAWGVGLIFVGLVAVGKALSG